MTARLRLRLPGAGPHSRRVRTVTWQAASALLAYPDEASVSRMRLALSATQALPATVGEPLASTAVHVTGLPLLRAQQEYVQTFDWKRRRALHLTYWTAGDTRNRGQALLRFAETYRAAGVEPPPGELPDHLTVLLEFAATVDDVAGLRLLAEHLTPLVMLAAALEVARSPYAGAVTAVLHTLPPAGPDHHAAARRLASTGPPVEAVGLDAYPTGAAVPR